MRPRPELQWERGAVLNAALVKDGDTYHTLYRAINHEAGWSEQNRGTYESSIGFAKSQDGLTWEANVEPVVPFGFVGDYEAEDPRVTRIGDIYYMTYCLYSISEGIPVPGYSVSKDLLHWEHKGELVPYESCGINKNAVLFPEKIDDKFVLMHRPECQAFKHLPFTDFDWRTWSRFNEMSEEQSPGITLSVSKDLKEWTETEIIMQPRKDCWDNYKVGPGAPPIATEKGWLVVYHGVDTNHVYRLGLAMLDKDNPKRVIARQKECLLEPELDWEKNGDVPNVVFTCGAVLEDNTLKVLYGGADRVLGWAEADVSAFIASC